MSEPMNPYAAPLTEPTYEPPVEERQKIVPVGKGARFLNLIIDYFAQGVVGFMVGVVFAVIGGDAGIRFVENTPSLVFGIPILLGYYFLMEATTSRTLGKLITGTKVVNEAGGKPTIGQIAGRTFCRLIPFEAFSFFGTPTRGWHDSIPKTYVIKSR